MTRVVAIILHAVPGAAAGPLERAFAGMRTENAARLAAGLTGAGATVVVEEAGAGGPPFGARLRRAAEGSPGAGLVVLGSGSVPLATAADLATFVDAAAADGPVLANNRYSADILAIPGSVDLQGLPDLAADNGLPRWLADRGLAVRDLASRWRLQVDLDSPLDGMLAGLVRPGGPDDPGAPDLFARALDVADRIRLVAADPGAELIVAGRTSSATLRWLERSTASRTRALIEERGMRTAPATQRPTRSILGFGLDHDGAGSLGATLGRLGDAALIDSRVLLAHRLGRDEAGWPAAEDRFASDLLLHESIRDPWLRDLTRAAASAPIPVLLGGHTLVGPGVRLLLGPGSGRLRGPRRR